LKASSSSFITASIPFSHCRFYAQSKNEKEINSPSSAYHSIVNKEFMEIVVFLCFYYLQEVTSILILVELSAEGAAWKNGNGRYIRMLKIR
jgi:hypothetical protein